jgi:predicted acetyltransferase
MAVPDLASRLSLVRPAVELVPSYLDFIEEMRALGETIWPSRIPSAGEGPDAFVAKLLTKESTATGAEIPESVFWGTVDARVVGVIALRHRLTEKLERFGGHVGYEVRPSCRRQGIATAMIRLLLATERARAMGRILVTCAPTVREERSRRAAACSSASSSWRR